MVKNFPNVQFVLNMFEIDKRYLQRQIDALERRIEQVNDMTANMGGW